MKPLAWLAALLLLHPAPAFAAGSPLGRWLTDDGSAIVRIGRCGEKLCGTIEKVLDPKAPANDINNPDKHLRTFPLAGATVLRGFSYSGGQWKGGRAYDPKTGNSYRSSLELLRDGRLAVTGCVLFVCRSRDWTRLN